jgi:predicted DNA-binding protein
MSTATFTPVMTVAKKPAKQTEPAKDRQVNFRASAKLSARLDNIADAMGLDVSNLVRLILNENLAAYEDRAERIRHGRTAKE